MPAQDCATRRHGPEHHCDARQIRTIPQTSGICYVDFACQIPGRGIGRTVPILNNPSFCIHDASGSSNVSSAWRNSAAEYLSFAQSERKHWPSVIKAAKIEAN